MTAAAILETSTPAPRAFIPEVRLFATVEGDPVALDRRIVGFVRGDRAGTLVVKTSGTKPVHLTAKFNEVFSW